MPSVGLPSDNGFARESERPDAHCIFCRRNFLLDAETSEGFELIFICRDCKIVVLGDLDTDTATQESTQSTQRQGGTASAEPVEDVFFLEFAELIDLVRNNHEIQQRAGYVLNRSISRRWQQLSFDNDSENFEPVDSLLNENDSIIDGVESDASVGGHSFLDRDFFVQQDGGSRISGDTDIDPMHAGQDDWNSDDQVEWEEADSDGETSGQGRQFLYTSNGMEEPEQPRYFGDSGDYLDVQGFEALLEHLAETESSRRGAPPAAASFVRSLPRVIISKVHEQNGSLICAVCKDPLPVGTETNRLPCLHFYHPSCILPWLQTRNSCPVCRFEVPTDDPDYETGKRIMGSRRETYEIQEQNILEQSLSSVSTGRGEAQGHPVVAESEEDNSNRRRRAGRWTYIAPIISMVGMVLVMWIGIPLAEGRSRNFQRHDSRELAGSNSSQVNQGNRSRRWFFF